MDYQLLDSGNGQKLEKFGDVILIRPCPAAMWKPKRGQLWREAQATFTRDGGNQWKVSGKVPEEWNITLKGLTFKLKRTDFGHLGIFPEQAMLWEKIQRNNLHNKKILNLFAYSGGSTLAAAKAGAQVYHLDAAKGMVNWASENSALNGISQVHWVVEDALKYLARAVKRGERFDAIIFDPPSFGRGKSGEVFKIENDLPFILECCQKLLSENPSFLLFTCHTPGYTPIVMRQLLDDLFKRKGVIEAGEMVIESPETYTVPCGTYAWWQP